MDFLPNPVMPEASISVAYRSRMLCFSPFETVVTLKGSVLFIVSAYSGSLIHPGLAHRFIVRFLHRTVHFLILISCFSSSYFV